jgi:hypothetical protein
LWWLVVRLWWCAAPTVWSGVWWCGARLLARPLTAMLAGSAVPRQR